MLVRALGLDPRELLDALLERMHYGRGAPPVFQRPTPGALTKGQLEYRRLMAAARGLPQAAGSGAERGAGGKRVPDFR